MNNPGYVSLMVVFRMLGVKADSKKLETSFAGTKDVDATIIRSAKEAGLKVKFSVFKENLFSKLTVPVIAKCKDDGFILILNNQADKWMILDPDKGNPIA